MNNDGKHFTSKRTAGLIYHNNPESVIEVFLDEAAGIVREVKCEL